MLEDNDADSSAQSMEDFDLLGQLNKLNLSDNVANGLAIAGPSSLVEDPTGDLLADELVRASSKILMRSNEVFNMHRASSKMKKILAMVKEIIGKNDKVIIVSQWTSVLTILMEHLANEHFNFVKLAGDTPVSKRNDIVVDFNKQSGPKVRRWW